ncbi:14309_t:CDS:1, partial [Dentiscutata heterogama]
WLPAEAFIHNNNIYKTCLACLSARFTKRAKKKALALNDELESMNNQVENQFNDKIDE